MKPNESDAPAPSSSSSNCHVCLSFAPYYSFHLFLSLLILVGLSCRLLFLSSLSGFLSVEIYSGTLCDEHRTQHIYFKNIVPTRAFLGGVLASVLSPPQTCNLNIFFGREWPCEVSSGIL